MTSRYSHMFRSAKAHLQAAFAASAMFASLGVHAQLVVSPQANILELAAAITGPGVTILNPEMHCHPEAFGEFSYTGSVLGVNEGVLLTTGRINNALGPNSVENRTFEQFFPGNALLNTVTGRTTFDACRFEFDIIPGGDTLIFNFAFASEEYNEWVGSQYNDVFGFFISGPGIVGDPGIAPQKNIALIPNTDQAVTINNVNNGSNPQYFFDNAGGQHIQYDGITQQLQAMAVVQPCETYRLKLIVADASDRKWDSGVFIERIQSNAVSMQTFTASGFNNMVEGCNSGWVRFTRQHVTADPLEVPFYIGGTATNGTDYPLIGSDPDPLVPKTITIPGNEAYFDLHFTPFDDGNAEGTEHLTIYLGNPACPGAVLDSIQFHIQDVLEPLVSAPTTICAGGNTTLSADGGLTYTWSPATGLSATDVATPLASPAATTTYQVTVSAGACTANASTTVTVSNMALSGTTTQPLCNGGSNGAIDLSVSGGIAPYTHAWSGPSGYSASTQDLVGIGSGTYSVTVTDGAGCTRTQSFNVNVPQALSLGITQSMLPFGQNISCAGGSDGWIDITVSNGTAPYTYAWTGPNGFTATSQDIDSLAAGTYQVLVTDANGCTIAGERTLVDTPVMEVAVIDVVGIVCHGDATGSATASVLGGIPPYAYAWNTQPVQTGATATNLGAGTWSVTVTDAYGCTSSAQAVVPGPATALSVSLTNITDMFMCQGNGNPHGNATAVVNGGTAPYTYHWNTVPPQDAAEGHFTAGGTWTVTVTDANDCVASTQVTVFSPGTAAITVTSQENASCDGSGGSATVALSGGAAIQSITWNTVPQQTGATATNLPPGTWTAVAQHANGCESSTSVTILGATTALGASVASVTGESCHGAADGSATIDVAGGTEPYTISWNTTPPQSGVTAMGLSAGSYTVTVTDANGCTQQLAVLVPGPTAPLSLAATFISGIPCFEGNTGSATVAAQGGTAPYSYTWNSEPPQTDATATGLVAGTYTATVTDANGCTATTEVTLIEPTIGVDVLIEDYQHITCHGAMDGTVTVTVTGGSGSYTMFWNTVPIQYGPTATGLGPGQYFVTVMDNNGCDTPKYAEVTLYQPDAPLALTTTESNYNGFNVSCPGSSNGSIQLTTTGGVPGFTYTWTGPNGFTASTQNISGLVAGTYQVQVQDLHGCVVGTSVTLVPPPSIAISGDVETASCQGSATGAVNTSTSGGVGGFSYAWSGPGGFSANTQDISGIPAGIYTLTVTDANGCTATQSFDVNEPGLFAVDATISAYNGGWNTSCAGATDGSITLDITGGEAPLSYSWTGPGGFTSTDEDLSGLVAGYYQLVITDASGCTALGAYTLNAPEALTITLNATAYQGFGISCHGANDGAVTALINGGTTPHTLAWNGPDGFSADQASITDLAPGTYTLVVTDANGCTAAADVTLTEPAPLNASATTSAEPSGDAIACHGSATGTIVLAINGGASPHVVLWSGPDGFSSGNTSLTGLAAGSYTAQVTDANGCSTTVNVTLTEPQPLNVDLVPSVFTGGHGVSCNGASDATIDATVQGGAGGEVISWSGPNGFSSTTPSIGGLEAGTYQVQVTDMNGCTAEASITITAPEPLVLDPIAVDQNGFGISCHGSDDGSISLNPTGGTAPFSIEWSGPDGYVGNGTDISTLAPGTYIATVSDANGCTATASVEITEPQPLSIQAVPATYEGGVNITCAGASDGSIDLTINGGAPTYTIVWTDGLGFFSNDEDIQDLTASIYSVTVTDANGCAADTLLQLSAPAVLEVSATLSSHGDHQLTCAEAADGSISTEVTGGTGPYTHLWSNGASSADINGLEPGTYTLEVTDANGCSATGTYTLTAPEPLSVAATAFLHANGLNVSCAGADDGAITTTIVGGTGPFTTSWSGPDGFSSNDPSPSGLNAGNYELTVTDAMGCTASANVVLSTPAPIAIQLSATNFNGDHQVSCHGGSNGNITGAVQGGIPGYTYQWTGPDGFNADTQNISGLPAGLYTVLVSDASGCSAEATIQLHQPEPLDIDLVLSDAGNGFHVGCTGDDGGIQTTVSGGTTAYQFDWTGPNGFASMAQDLDGLMPGTYVLNITDANGCTASTTATLTQADALTATFNNTPTLCHGDDSGALGITVDGGQAPYTFAWSGPDGFSSNDEAPSGVAAGAYTVNVSDAAGCQTSFSTTVGSPAPLATGTYVSFYGQYNLQCEGDSSGVIDLAPMGGTAPYDVLVTLPGGATSTALSYTDLPAGAYLVQITDANGCTMDSTIVLTQPALPIDVELSVSVYPSGTNVSCHGASDGWISASVTGGSGTYTFAWRGPDSLEWNTPDIYGLPAGDYAYELVVIDDNQCSFTTTITLTQPDSALSALSITSAYEGGHQVSCNGEVDGWIDLSILGGNGGNTVQWNGPNSFTSNDEDLTDLGAGTYVATVTDMNGCMAEHSVTLAAPEPLQALLSAFNFPGGTQISCTGANDGSINAAISGGTEDYTLAWSGPDGFAHSDAGIGALAPGEYCLQVVDANGCQAQECIMLIEPLPLELSADASVAECGQQIGAVDLQVSGGSAPFAYAWSNGDTSEDLNGLAPGQYAVTVTDANGCTATLSTEVTGTPAVTAEGNTFDNLCHGGSDGAIDLTVTGGTAPFSYAWAHGPDSEDLFDLPAGAYTVTVTDANGCSFQETYNVGQSDELDIQATLSEYHGGYNVSPYQGTNGSIELSVTGGNGPYTYLWSNGATTPGLSGMTAGTYGVEVTDVNGCTAFITIVLTEPNDLQMPTGFTPNQDGMNDTFFVQGLDAYPRNQLTIVNRWGNVVFDRLNYRNDWRGENMQGGELPNGTYFAILKVNEGERILQGYVDLRR